MYLIGVHRCEISVSRLEAEVRQDTEKEELSVSLH